MPLGEQPLLHVKRATADPASPGQPLALGPEGSTFVLTVWNRRLEIGMPATTTARRPSPTALHDPGSGLRPTKPSQNFAFSRTPIARSPAKHWTSAPFGPHRKSFLPQRPGPARTSSERRPSVSTRPRSNSNKSEQGRTGPRTHPQAFGPTGRESTRKNLKKAETPTRRSPAIHGVSARSDRSEKNSPKT